MNNRLKFIDGELATKNLIPGSKTYGEDVKRYKGEEYRIWRKDKSKLSSMIQEGLELELNHRDEVLYLGISTGTTASHLSDLIPKGRLYGVEYSEKVLEKMISRCKNRGNIIPLLGDGRKPRNYSKWICSVDFLYQDVTQKDQAHIANRNAKMFLKEGGQLILMIKASSIDITKSSEEVFDDEINRLEGFKIQEKIRLDPRYKNHIGVKAEFIGN